MWTAIRDPDATLHELYARIVFNVLVGNTDDHARNHAAFCDGRALQLTPAYDVCPWLRRGGEASQAMIIDKSGRRAASLALCAQAAPIYHLDAKQARGIIDDQVSTIEASWRDVCEQAEFTRVDRERLRNGAVLHPSVFYDYPTDLRFPWCRR
jgi:serine/threonine-protein kinase HipA